MIAPEPVLRGVAGNPGAPVAVLLRLLAPEARAAREVFTRRPFPEAFVEAVLASPERAVRVAIAANPWLSEEHCLRLAADPDDLVVLKSVSGPLVAQRPRPLSDAVLEQVLLHHRGRLVSTKEIVDEMAGSGTVSGGSVRRAAAHPAPELRRFACGYFDELGAQQRAALLDDPDPEVRAVARQAAAVTPLTAEELAATGEHRHRTALFSHRRIPPELFEVGVAEGHARFLANNRHLDLDAVRSLALHPDPYTRYLVAQRGDLTPELVALLAADTDPDVRRRARAEPAPRHPARTRVLNRVVDPGHIMRLNVEPVERPDPDWYRACARSPQSALRRAAASCFDLDAATVRQLAADDDPAVRMLLALFHPDAPPALLLEAYLALPLHRARLRLRPTFPSRRLPAEYARHDDPEVRELAAADPEFEGDLAALLADPASDVRRAAAANPRTPASTVEALLADPGAAPELLEGAAANPQVTARQLDNLLDRAGVPR